jgi:uncharacterized protein (TIGR00369 family)
VVEGAAAVEGAGAARAVPEPAPAGEVWRQPVRGEAFPPQLRGLPGADQLRLLLSGRVAPPPISHLVGMRLTEVGGGTATFVMPITGWLQTPQGVIAAGEVAILADASLGSAIHTILPGGTGYSTTELSINMVRPVPRLGHLIGRGRLIHGGRRLALSEVFVTDDTGRLIAHGTSRCVIFPPTEPADQPGAATPAEAAGPPEPLSSRDDDGGWVPPFRRAPVGTILDQEVFSARSGLEVLRAQIAGDLPLPPLSHLLGAAPVAADEGSCVFNMPASGWLASPLGTVEGGITACLADVTMACAVQTTVPAGSAYAPTDLRVQFLRPVPPDGGPLTCRAAVVHRGRGLAVARAEVSNADQKLVALANASAMILPGRRADLADAGGLG